MLATASRRVAQVAAIALMLASANVRSEVVGQNNYAAVRIDGANGVGSHMAFFFDTVSGQRAGFIYAADLQSLWFSRCTTFGCTFELSVSGGPGNDRGRFVSATRKLDGNPIAALYDATAGDLRLVDCATADCTLRNERLLDASGNVGAGTAIGLDPLSGAPAIAYYDAGNGDLKLYRCTDPNCAGGVVSVIDTEGNVGRNPNIAFRGDGRVFIAYDDVTSGQVRVATALSIAQPFAIGVSGPGSHGQLAPAPAPAPPVLFVGADGPDSQLARHACANDSCSAGTRVALTETGAGIAPSLARAFDGRTFLTHRSGDGRLLATICVTLDCSTRSQVTLDGAADTAVRSIVLWSPQGFVYTLYRSDEKRLVRQAFCADLACSQITRAVATNGVEIGSARGALRADGRPLIVYQRRDDGFRLWLAQCADASCSAWSRTPLPGSAPGLSVPDIAIRPDGRPVIYFGADGGSSLLICDDPACATWTTRVISAAGSNSGRNTSLALRADGRPVLLYVQRPIGLSYSIRLYTCADVDCTSGSDVGLDTRSGITRDTVRVSLVIDASDRPMAIYTFLASPLAGTFDARFIRCTDSACTDRSVSDFSAAIGSTLPMAVRSDGRLVVRENLLPIGELAICATPDCTPGAITRTPFPLANRNSWSLLLTSTDTPILGTTLSTGSAGFDVCGDFNCTTASFVSAIADTTPGQFFEGFALRGSDGHLVGVWRDDLLRDAWLSVRDADILFVDGFDI